MSLLADDGTVLQPKEAIVLDQDGQQLTGSSARVNGRSFSFPIPAIIPIIVGAVVFIPIALALGAAFISVVGVLLAVFFVLSAISRVFKGR